MATKVEKLEAELVLVKLEEKFVAAKEADRVTPKMKVTLRETRQDFRDNYRSTAPAGAQPATITPKVGK